MEGEEVNRARLRNVVCALQGSKVRAQVLCDGSHLAVTAVGGEVLLDHAPPLPHPPREERTLLHRLTVFLTQRSTGLRGGGCGRGDTALNKPPDEYIERRERVQSCQEGVFSQKNGDIYGQIYAFRRHGACLSTPTGLQGAWNNMTQNHCTFSYKGERENQHNYLI